MTSLHVLVRGLGLGLGALVLGGCMAMTVAGAAVSVGATAVGAAADVTIGAAKLTGKAVGAAVDAVGSDDKQAPKDEPAPQENNKPAAPPPGPGGPRR